MKVIKTAQLLNIIEEADKLVDTLLPHHEVEDVETADSPETLLEDEVEVSDDGISHSGDFHHDGGIAHDLHVDFGDDEGDEFAADDGMIDIKIELAPDEEQPLDVEVNGHEIDLGLDDLEDTNDPSLGLHELAEEEYDEEGDTDQFSELSLDGELDGEFNLDDAIKEQDDEELELDDLLDDEPDSELDGLILEDEDDDRELGLRHLSD